MMMMMMMRTALFLLFKYLQESENQLNFTSILSKQYVRKGILEYVYISDLCLLNVALIGWF